MFCYTRHPIRPIAVPGEGSCLFLSINYLLNGGKIDLDSPGPMRKIVVDALRKDPAKYKDEVREGYTVEEYCDWIMDNNSWGGRLEIKLLAQHYGVQITSLHIHKNPIDWTEYEKERNYQYRILLLYTGEHYDPLRTFRKTRFPLSDKVIMEKGRTLIWET